MHTCQFSSFFFILVPSLIRLAYSVLKWTVTRTYWTCGRTSRIRLLVEGKIGWGRSILRGTESKWPSYHGSRCIFLNCMPSLILSVSSLCFSEPGLLSIKSRPLVDDRKSTLPSLCFPLLCEPHSSLPPGPLPSGSPYRSSSSSSPSSVTTLVAEAPDSLLHSSYLNWYHLYSQSPRSSATTPAVHALCPQRGPPPSSPSCFTSLFLLDTPKLCAADILWSDASIWLSRSAGSLRIPLTYSWACWANHNPRSLLKWALRFLIWAFRVPEKSRGHLHTWPAHDAILVRNHNLSLLWALGLDTLPPRKLYNAFPCLKPDLNVTSCLFPI